MFKIRVTAENRVGLEDEFGFGWRQWPPWFHPLDIHLLLRR